MDDNFWVAFLITSAAPMLITLICLVVTVVVFVRQADLGGAGVPAGLGFLALALSAAVHVAVIYVPLAAMANHQSVKEAAAMIGVWGLGGTVLEIAGLLLVALALFQRRPSGT